MKSYFKILILIIGGFICQNSLNSQNIKNKEYELMLPYKKVKSVLVLFPGFPETPTDIKREFKIIKEAKKNNVALVFMNYNQKLFLEQEDKKYVANLIQNIIEKHSLPKWKVFLGGFSSGGNVSLLVGNYMLQKKRFYIQPKGIFIIDSPIDLLELYLTSLKNIERNFSEIAVEESKWICNFFEEKMKKTKDTISFFEKYAVYTQKTHHIENLKHLKNTKLRLYTEPDILWWKENRMADYENTNAYAIKKLSEDLIQEFGKEQVEYIATKDKGYRVNGMRHPHSWSIVDPKELIQWIKEN